jgi:uncharacterized damage-inducible protein DinB
MNELARALIGDSAAAPAAHILEGLADGVVHTRPPNVPHSIYEELWHLAFWQQLTLDWVRDRPTPYPATPSDGFPPHPNPEASNFETWTQLRQRFLQGAEQAAAAANETSRLDHPVRCPSRPGEPVRIMTVREQLESLAAHNSYHLGRIVLLRQIQQAWPPPSGGFTW